MKEGPVLHVLSGDLAGRAYLVEEREFVIGRSPSCNLVIPKRYISRQHARIVGKRGGFVVKSLSEKNPVQLRNRPVSKAQLADGDEFEVCGIRFRFALKGKVRERKVGPQRFDSGSAAGGVDDGWDEPQGDDGWDEPKGDDGWDEPKADDGWDEPKADDGWDDEPKADDGWDDDGWDDDESAPAKQKPARSKTPLKTKQSVRFDDDDDDEGEGEDTEEVNEKTAELNPTVDPDDPDYDPFAEVDNRVKAEKKTVDPQREKLLRVLLGVAMLGIVFAGFVVWKVMQPPPLTLTEYNDGEEIVLAVDEVRVVEYPYSPTNPPQGFDTRPIDFTGGYQKFHEDETAQVEWLNYPNRVVLLIRGLEEGPSAFTLFFHRSNTRMTFRINVEGDPPLEVAREERQAEFKKLKPNQLRQKMAQAMSRGDGYIEGYGPGKEHFYWLALMEYEQALDAGNALRDLSAGAASVLSQKDRENLADANKKLEDTRELYERTREQLEQRYQQTFTQRLPAKRKLNALRALMRGIGHEGDVQFKRLLFALEDTQRGFGKRWKGF